MFIILFLNVEYDFRHHEVKWAILTFKNKKHAVKGFPPLEVNPEISSF